MKRLWKTTGGVRQLGVLPVLLVLVLGTVHTGASTGAPGVPCLFDLSLEALMHIHIGAELRWSCRPPAEESAPDTGQYEFQGETQDGTLLPVVRRHEADRDTEDNMPAVAWNR